MFPLRSLVWRLNGIAEFEVSLADRTIDLCRLGGKGKASVRGSFVPPRPAWAGVCELQH